MERRSVTLALGVSKASALSLLSSPQAGELWQFAMDLAQLGWKAALWLGQTGEG